MKVLNEDTVLLMAEVEGYRWLTITLEEGPYTSRGAAEWLKEMGRYILDIDHQEELSASYCIYGDGGINRWYVDSAGAVSFSKDHCYKAKIVDRVHKMGFTIR